MTKQWLRAVGTAAVLTLVAVSAQADVALFSPLDLAAHGKALTFDTSYEALVNDPATGNMQLVQANAAALTNKTATVTLGLAPGYEVRAHQVESYRSESGNLVWSGVVEDPGAVTVPFSPEALRFDPLNTVIMVKDGDTINGNVHVGGHWYAIRSLKSGGHAIVEMNMAAMPKDHPAEYAKLPTVRMRPRNSGNKATVRVMVHYTSSAASAAGNISSLIDLAIAESNTGYANSGVNMSLQLATKAQVTYTQSGSFSTDLSRYRGTSDGYMDSIHTTRNSVAADVGVLVINNSSSCGLASSIGSTASTAFAAAHWSCITGYYSFAHEIGHLLSARHDPATDPTTTPYAYGHGYRYLGSPDWRTIMAYDCPGGCPRLNYWSSPLKLYNGVAMGTSSQSDNARVLNATNATVAGFR